MPNAIQASDRLKPEGRVEWTRAQTPGGKEIRLEGRISGLDCFLEAELCGPDHVWKKGEVAGVVTDEFHWYYVNGSKTGNGIPRDVLVQFFLARARVKGTLYQDIITLLRPELEVWQDGRWIKVWPQSR